MNHEWDGLLRNVLENPKSDEPRLICADWLEENGYHIRAEFIRVGCKAASLIRELEGCFCWDEHDDLPRDCDCCLQILEELKPLEEREKELSKYPLTDIACVMRTKFYTPPVHLLCADNLFWHRGFLDEVIYSSKGWLASADLITAEHPITKVGLIDQPIIGYKKDHDNGGGGYFLGRSYSEMCHRRNPKCLDSTKGKSYGERGIILWLLNAEWPNIDFKVAR